MQILPTRAQTSVESGVKTVEVKPILPTYSTQAPRHVESAFVKPTPTQSSTQGNGLYISVGVSGLVVLLIAVSLVLISVTVCLRQRKKRILITSSNVAYTTTSGGLSMNKWTPAQEHTSENVAYGAAVAQNELELSANLAYTGRLEVKNNEAYTATSTGGGARVVDEEKYDYITGNDVIVTTTTANEAYGMSGDVSVSPNQAYGLLHS